jgi:hypothetical protein
MLKERLSWALPGVVFVAAFSLSAACGSEDIAPPNPACNNGEANGSTSGAGGSTSSGNGTSTGAGAGSQTQVTPQEVIARIHGCRKIRYQSLGNMLVDRGVDLSDNSPTSAGFLYTNAEDAFSVPKLDSRRGEKDGHTTASALKLFDIFVQAAPEIIANIESPQMAPACAINGQGFPMFDPGDGSCVEEAVSCLIGSPATTDHLALCNLILDRANLSDPNDLTRKRHIAVATLLSAAHSCE